MNTRLMMVSGLFIIFLLLRLAALYNVNVFEDHDSIQYLTMMRNFTEGDFDSYFSYNPDKTFVFSTLGGLFYFLTNSAETAARLVSLISNIALAESRSFNGAIRRPQLPITGLSMAGKPSFLRAFIEADSVNAR